MGHQKKFNAAVVNRDIQSVIRTFRTIHVVIKRASRTFSTLGTAALNLDTAVLVYQGEALDIPGEGSLFKYPMGEVRIEGPSLLINGKRAIEQGDFVTMPDNRLYIVKVPKDWWGVWTLVGLQQYQQ